MAIDLKVIKVNKVIKVIKVNKVIKVPKDLKDLKDLKVLKVLKVPKNPPKNLVVSKFFLFFAKEKTMRPADVKLGIRGRDIEGSAKPSTA